MALDELVADAPEAPAPERRSPTTLIAGLWGAYGLVVVLLVLAIQTRAAWLIVPGTLTLAACALVMDLVTGRTRAAVGGLGAQLRLPLAAMAIGAAALVVWLAGHQRNDGWGFLGASVIVLAGGQVVAAVRTAGKPGWPGGAAIFGTGVALGALRLVAPATVPGVVALLGVFVALGGLGLLSERLLRRLTGRAPVGRSRPALSPGAVGAFAAGVLLVVLAVVLLPGGNVALYALLLVLAIVVVVGAIASNTSTDVVVVLFAAALAWALTPHGVPPDQGLETSPGHPTMVALGDSYISGEGAKRFYAGTNTKGINECRRAPTAYPVLAARGTSDAVPDQVIFVACSGAKAIDIAGRAQYSGDPRDVPGGLDQIHHYLKMRKDLNLTDDEVELAVVSIGGNDFGFGEVVQTCIRPGNCAELGAVWLQRLDQRRKKVDRAFAELRETLGRRVPILVVPYPIPLSERYCGASLLQPEEHRFLAGYAHELDAVVVDAAERAGLYHLDAMANALAERNLRLCDGGPRSIGVHAVSPGSTEGSLEQRANPTHWFHNSFHPNTTGHAAMAATLTRWLEDHPHLTPATPPTTPPSGHRIATVGSIMHGHLSFHVCQLDMSDCGGSVDAWKTSKMWDLAWRLLPGLAAALAGACLAWFAVVSAWRLR